MAKLSLYFDKLIRKEGGFVNHPADPGGATNMGITIANWKAYGKDKDNDGDIDEADLRFIDRTDAFEFYQKRFWNPMNLHLFQSQDLAEIVFDHAVNAGISRAVKMLQFILHYQYGRKEIGMDGILGMQTLSAVNKVSDEVGLYNSFRDFRIAYYQYRANQNTRNRQFDPFFSAMKVSPSDTAKVFYAGWINRVNAFAKKKQSTSRKAS